MRMISSLPALAAGALLLAGCGAPAAAPSQPPATQAPAGPAGSAAPTPSAASSTEAPAGGGGSSVQDFLDLVSKAKMTTYTMDMSMTTTMDGSALEMTTSGAFDNTDPDKPASHLTMNVSGLEMEMIIVGGDYFLKMAMTGDQWMKMDAESARQMTGSAAPDFSTWADENGDTVKDVEVVGQETIGGVGTTHYRLTMTPEAVEEFGVDDDALEGATLGYDMWVDGDGFTRKFDVAITGGSVPVTMTATLDDFNEPVDIKAPKKWTEMPS